MKTLFLILFTIFSLKLSSQVITLTFDESETLFKEGNYVDLNIVQLLESDPLYFCYGGINTKKVFDLNKKVVLFYVNNEVNDTINIKNFDLKNGIYNLFVSLFNNLVIDYGPTEAVHLSTQFLDEISTNFKQILNNNTESKE